MFDIVSNGTLMHECILCFLVQINDIVFVEPSFSTFSSSNCWSLNKYNLCSHRVLSQCILFYFLFYFCVKTLYKYIKMA